MRPQLRRFIGERIGGEPDLGEIGHFYLCRACQQPVDKRDLAAVFHHEEPGHAPLSAEDAERFLRISEQLRSTLERKPKSTD
jgi:bifunctional non-homologous end joining protein LigD